MATCTSPAQTWAGHHNSSAVSAALINRPQNSRTIDVGSCEFVSRGCESADQAMRRSVGVGHRSSPSISHAIRSSDQLAMSRKPRNFNDVDSKFERRVGELHVKFGGGVLPWGRGDPGGLWVSGIPACQRLLGAGGCWVPGVAGWQRFVSQSKLQADGPRRVPGISGPRTLRGAGRRHRMITILIHIHVRST